jgi:hypothetical protein
LNPGRRGGKPATNRFSYGAVSESSKAGSKRAVLSIMMMMIMSAIGIETLMHNPHNKSIQIEVILL